MKRLLLALCLCGLFGATADGEERADGNQGCGAAVAGVAEPGNVPDLSGYSDQALERIAAGADPRWAEFSDDQLGRIAAGEDPRTACPSDEEIERTAAEGQAREQLGQLKYETGEVFDEIWSCAKVQGAVESKILRVEALGADAHAADVLRDLRRAAVLLQYARTTAAKSLRAAAKLENAWAEKHSPRGR
jgi:hypothetical protein